MQNQNLRNGARARDPASFRLNLAAILRPRAARAAQDGTNSRPRGNSTFSRADQIGKARGLCLGATSIRAPFASSEGLPMPRCFSDGLGYRHRTAQTETAQGLKVTVCAPRRSHRDLPLPLWIGRACAPSPTSSPSRAWDHPPDHAISHFFRRHCVWILRPPSCDRSPGGLER